MAKSKVCACKHVSGDHDHKTRIVIDGQWITTIHGECLWDGCDCKEFDLLVEKEVNYKIRVIYPTTNLSKALRW